MQPVSVEEYRRKARRRLPRMVFDYLEGGAESETGLRYNCDAFDAYRFRPRRLVDVSARSQTARLWSRSHEAPVFLAPTGLNGILRPGADAMLARAAAKAGIPFALSTASNMSIEEIADCSDGAKWFQLYVLHRDIAWQMCDRARAADYDALILTVDVPVNGYRERDMRNGFGVPVKYTWRTILDGATHPGWSLDFWRAGVPRFRNFETLEAVSDDAQAALMRREMDASFDFDALRELRDRWPRKLIVKGVARAEDVARCAEIGVDAVILSNHGARQLDGTGSALDMLVECGAQSGLSIFVDGGVRRGADIVKALCLGASMVGLGRAALYAVASDGEEGVARCLAILKDEMDRAQAMLGAPALADLTRDLVFDTRNPETLRKPVSPVAARKTPAQWEALTGGKAAAGSHGRD